MPALHGDAPEPVRSGMRVRALDRDVGLRERQRVTRDERVVADEAHARAVVAVALRPRARVAHFAADHHAGEPVGDVFAGELARQRQRARAEDVVRAGCQAPRPRATPRANAGPMPSVGRRRGQAAEDAVRRAGRSRSRRS